MGIEVFYKGRREFLALRRRKNPKRNSF